MFLFEKKPSRFAPALITKIINQVENISQIINFGNYTFKHQDFQETLRLMIASLIRR